MLLLTVGLILFFSIHSLPFIAPQWRERKRREWGAPAWRWIHSFGSIVAVGLIAWGYAAARVTPVVLYVPPAWTRNVTLLLMLAVFPMVYATFLPCRIHSALKYPDLVAIKTWAVAHLLANGMLADVLLFGGFLAWAVVNRISLKHRVRSLPLGVASPFNDLVCVIAGVVTYLLILLFLHRALIGISPI